MKKLVVYFMFLVCFSCSNKPARTPTFDKDSSYSYEVGFVLDKSYPSDEEKRIFRLIEEETYEGELHDITFDVKGKHVYYTSTGDPFVVGDCAFYTFVRWMHHACQLGWIADKDLWKRNSIQDLRNILADRISFKGRFDKDHVAGFTKEDIKKMGVFLDFPHENIRFLFFPLKLDEYLPVFSLLRFKFKNLPDDSVQANAITVQEDYFRLHKQDF
jgi:hypothetical protein